MINSALRKLGATQNRLVAKTLGVTLPVFFGAALFSCSPSDSTTKKPIDYVDPFIGTDFFGHTFPGAAMPYGMVQLSPDQFTQGWTYSSGYNYSDSTIIGFSHSHFSGIGMTAGGDILVMPTATNKIQTNPGTREDPDSGYRSRFNKSDEVASPGYYSVILKDDGIKAELTTSKRVGMHRYTFPKSKKSNILIDLGHEIGDDKLSGPSFLKIINDTLIEGYKDANGVKVYFVASFNKPFGYYGTWDSDYIMPESSESSWPYKDEEQGLNIGSFVGYNTAKGEQVLMKVAISYVSLDGARKNLSTEIPHWDFDKVKNDARKAWEGALSTVSIQGTTQEKKQIFYSSMYHSILSQFIGQDVDGQYYGMDRQIHKADGYDLTPNFSCWDTYRSQHPLLTIIAPDRVNGLIRSIAAKTKEFGWLPSQHFRNEPKVSMVGDHLIPVIVDAYKKGYRDWDVEAVYAAMRRKALEMPTGTVPLSAGRSGLKEYMTLGYAACDRVTESVPNTMELAYDDWCIAEMAKALGKKEDAELFTKRALNYKNVYNPKTSFMQPRKQNGEFLEEIGNNEQKIVTVGDHSYYGYFDPLLIGRRPNRHYTESNAWQYLWSVQHDAAGLINLMGGNDAFTKRLDTFFTMSGAITPPKYVGTVGNIGQYVHGNQPSHHVAYLYNYAGQPWKTQEKVREVVNRFYRTGPGGLPGNDDMGSLSSWFILSSMGFYSVTPGSTSYAIGSPSFGEVEITVKDGKKFKIIAENNSPENVYIQSATLNGKDFNRTYIEHAEIMDGGELKFVMGNTPAKSWGVAKNAAPYSLSAQ